MALYNGSMWDKWSHSLIPTPTNPLSPIFALLDPYYLEDAHSEDRPYPVSGPMFTEGTPWGAILNPTIGALIKPEREEHPWRLRNGIDIYNLMYNVNESIRERARDITRTHYITLKGGEISSVDFNVLTAPLSSSKVISTQFNTENDLPIVQSGTYGIYDTGSRSYSFGSSGNPAIGVYTAGNLGAAPNGGFDQNLASGFNSLTDNKKAGLYLLPRSEEITTSEAARQALFGLSDELTKHGDVVVNEKGEIGIYHDRPIEKPKGDKFTQVEKLGISSVISPWARNDKQYILSQIADVNRDFIKSTKERVDSPYAINEDTGFTSGQKLSSFNPSISMELLNDADTVSDLMNQGNGSDFVKNASTSLRLIGGIYGYMGSELVGFGVHNEKTLANSSDMYAFNRGFWDLNLGGAGGAVSEIGRRFIPNFGRLNKVNPLMNEMPDWLPERFRVGDAFATKIPKGEMRLPGKGWETLNELHPDAYGDYGAFDRFKILADIAPNSPEYRLWREIAKRTITDPELLEEMEEIKQRARQQGKQHDFYDYKVIGKNLEYQNVVVSEVLGYGKFRSGQTIYKMAGITVKGNNEENAQQVLSRYLTPGQEITIAVDPNQAYAQNKDAQKTINAAVFVHGESVNKLMMESGDAQERKGDKSAAATIGQMSAFQKMIGLASETIGHLDIPIISDQWLRIRSPLESYEAEQIYGTPYQSWAHPINTFLYPAIERAIHEQSAQDLAIFDIFSYIQKTNKIPLIDLTKYGIPVKFESRQINRGTKQLLYMTSILTNRATLIGHAIGNMIDAGNSKLAMPISTGLNLAIASAHMLSGGSSYSDMATLGLYTGIEAARVNEVSGMKGRLKYGAVGAALSIGWRFVHNSLWGEWQPQRPKRNWEMQDYWDRLTYIKYQGLYKEAARRALEEEGIDVEAVLKGTEEKEEKRKSTLKNLKRIKEALNSAYGGKTNELKNNLLKMVNSRISELQPSTSMVEGGKYTQSAIIYKRAAEATMYGLKKGASWSSIISALPTNDKEYFMEFVQETDPKKRDEILSKVSPSLKRALQLSWGMKTEKKQSNEDFFKEHYLPDSDWKGWRPDVDLKDIQVKTVDNEDMNLSDFGFFENQLREPSVEEASALPYKDTNTDISISYELRRLLKGKGLTNVEVNVSEKNTMGPTDIIANFGIWLGIYDRKKVEDTAGAWI